MNTSKDRESVVSRFDINVPYIVHETIEGETIVLNLKNGHYYSFDGIGPLVWEMIVAGVEVDRIAEGLKKAIPDVSFDLPEVVDEFIEELKSNEIITERTIGDEPVTETASAESAIPSVIAADQLMPPRFHRYTDMRDVLLLDPIHDVDSKGWPEPMASEYKEGVPIKNRDNTTEWLR